MAKKTVSKQRSCGKHVFAGVLATVSLCVGMLAPMTGCAKTLTYTLEAGNDLPSPYRLVGADGATYVAGFDETCVNRPGTYKIPMTDASGKKYVLKLTVRDRKAPVVTTRHVYYAKGVGVPDALDFINTITEADEYHGLPPNYNYLLSLRRVAYRLFRVKLFAVDRICFLHVCLLYFSQERMTLPDRPEFIASKPFSKSL